jgi:3D-(3,5/4)-trihydroxycyclohexane-1,2-dione acylhydrolase (decyclizing)
MRSCRRSRSIEPSVITIETDRNARVGSFESWWDVPIAEVSEQPSVSDARSEYEKKRLQERWLV